MTLNARRAKDRRRAYGLRCFVNGVDVTRVCVYVDVRRRRVRLYRLNHNGSYYASQRRKSLMVIEYRARRVELRPRSSAVENRPDIYLQIYQAQVTGRLGSIVREVP